MNGISSQERSAIWGLQLKMANALLDVCKRNGLHIWAASGTMLGTVRHKGFIPWDDDMDFFMFRKDYDSLLQIAENEFKPPFFFQSPYSENGYYRGHSQIRYEGTSMILPNEAAVGYDFNQGVFVDIFPLDGYPEDEGTLRKICYEAYDIRKYLWFRRYPLDRYSHIHQFYRVRKLLGEKRDWSDLQLYEYMENLFRKYPSETSTYVGFLSIHRNPKHKRKREWFEKTILLPFENILIPVPAAYDAILRLQYGNYMTPSHEASLHGNTIIDTLHSYREFLPPLKMSPFATFAFLIKNICKTIHNRVSRKRQ